MCYFSGASFPHHSCLYLVHLTASRCWGLNPFTGLCSQGGGVRGRLTSGRLFKNQNSFQNKAEPVCGWLDEDFWWLMTAWGRVGAKEWAPPDFLAALHLPADENVVTKASCSPGCSAGTGWSIPASTAAAELERPAGRGAARPGVISPEGDLASRAGPCFAFPSGLLGSRFPADGWGSRPQRPPHPELISPWFGGSCPEEAEAERRR